MEVTLTGLEQRGMVERYPADGRRAVMPVAEAGALAALGRRSARAEQLAKALVSGELTRAELETMRASAPLIERLRESL